MDFIDEGEVLHVEKRNLQDQLRAFPSYEEDDGR